VFNRIRARGVVRARNSRSAFRLNQWRLRLETRRADDLGVVRAARGARERLVALTYDDGPSDANTPELLEILAAAGAGATFFVVGSEAERRPDLVARIASEGHDLGNHSYSHRHPAELDLPGFHLEVERGSDVISAVAGPVRFFRPPYGKRWREAADICSGLGLRSVLWSVDSGDTKLGSAAQIVREVVGHVEPGDIVLMHDGGARRQRTIDATREILVELGRQGYKFVTLSELLGDDVAATRAPDANQALAQPDQ
jgi:peptidoglycan-N-acetylglucosamine deacetylase